MIEIHITNYGSLMIQQLYTILVEDSRKEGGELSTRTNFILDEFSNFPKIDNFQSMLTVSRGRNIRFVICLQSFAQIEERYGKEGAQNILDNCSWMYLKTSNNDTANKISERLGMYTVQSYGESSNTNIKYNNSSSNMSLTARKLLTPDEVLRIESPYILVMLLGKSPVICCVPDISKMHFNKLNGMGNEKYNKQLKIQRENQREIKPIVPIKIWDIWNRYIEIKGGDVIKPIQKNIMPRKKVSNEKETENKADN